VRRVVLVLTDGLRPDAITPTDMPSLDSLSRTYTTALRASTVRPSRTVAALASLATGVAPATHGLIEPGLAFLKRLPSLRPLARELTRGGIPSQVLASELLPAERAVLWALTKAAGLGRYRSAGLRAREVARSALTVALGQEDGGGWSSSISTIVIRLVTRMAGCRRSTAQQPWRSMPQSEYWRT